jgi:RNA-binding protein
MTWNKQLDKALTKKLIGLSHPLKPAVVVGHAGLTEAVIQQVQKVQKTHDLIKVRVELDNRVEVQAAAEQLASKTESILVNRIGKVAVLYKPQEEEAEETAPKRTPPAPKRRPRRR